VRSLLLVGRMSIYLSRSNFFEKKDVGRVQIFERDEAHAFVEAGCVCVFGAEAYATEVLSRICDEGRD